MEIDRSTASTSRPPVIPARATVNATSATPQATGKRKFCEFIDSMARETPAKSRRLTIAQQMMTYEKDRERVAVRLRKNKERAQDVMAKIEADEIEKANLDANLQRLKAETKDLE